MIWPPKLLYDKYPYKWDTLMAMGTKKQAFCLATSGSRKQLIGSEEHTSELQSHSDLVCRLLLEKKKTKKPSTQTL